MIQEFFIVSFYGTKWYKKNEKKRQKYECKFCDFHTSKKTDYVRHLSTDKHKNVENDTKMVQNDTKKTKKNEKNIYTCECGKIYKYSSGYYRHRKKCNSDEFIDGIEEVIIDKT